MKIGTVVAVSLACLLLANPVTLASSTAGGSSHVSGPSSAPAVVRPSSPRIPGMPTGTFAQAGPSPAGASSASSLAAMVMPFATLGSPAAAAAAVPSLANCGSSVRSEFCPSLLEKTGAPNGTPVTNATHIMPDCWVFCTYMWCLGGTVSLSPSYSGAISGTSGSATLSASLSVTVSLSACAHFKIYFQFPSVDIDLYYLNFYESYSETLSATLTAGSSGFSENDFNSQPISLAGADVPVWSLYDIITLTLGIHLAVEYNLSMDANSWVSFNQGSSGWADQYYDFNTSAWTDTNAPITCANSGESVSTGCATISTSTPFGGGAAIRIGPELSTTLAVVDLPVIGSLGSVSAWAFLYGQLTLFYGVGPAPGDVSGGQCGSGYAVVGMPSASRFAYQPWLAACWDVGLQLGASWEVLFNLFSGTLFSTTFILWAGPLATTMNVYDSDAYRFTTALTSSNPVAPDPYFQMEVSSPNNFYVYSPLVAVGYSSTGGSWASPSCGSIYVEPVSPAGSEITYNSPGSPGTCQLTVNAGLLFGLSIPTLQINSVTFDVKILSALQWSASHVTQLHFLGGKCWPIEVCIGSTVAPHWTLSLQGTGNISNIRYVTTGPAALALNNVSLGNYTYLIDPLPGLTPTGGVSGNLSVAGPDQLLTINFSRLALIFERTGLPSDARWGVTVDGVTENSTNATLVFNATPGNITYRVNAVSGYYVSPSNTSSVMLNSTDVVVPVPFVSGRSSAPPPPLPQSFLVPFVPAGLPAGEVWSATVFPGATSTGAVPTFDLPNGTYNYSVLAPQGFMAAPGAGMFVVQGSQTPPVLVPFVPITYPVTIGAFGLPPGTPWTVTIDGTPLTVNGTTAVFDLPNGSYDYAINPVPNYAATLEGNVVVDGAPALASAYFTPVTYFVVLDESGLPVATPFTATVAGQTLTTSVNGSVASLVFEEFNGSWAYDIVNPTGWTGGTSGTVVVKGALVNLNTTFTPAGKPYYKLTFKETGLPKNATNWSVVLGTTTLDTSTSKAVFSVEDGTYSYTVPAVPGYAPVKGSGSVTIHGGSKTVTIKFKPVLYAVTFTEGGLPSGHSWSVTVPGFGTKKSKTDTIVFNLPNGTYDFLVGAVKGYTSSAVPLPVVVDGAPAPVAVTFVRNAAGIVLSVAPNGDRPAASSSEGRLAQVSAAVAERSLLLVFLASLTALGAVRRRSSKG